MDAKNQLCMYLSWSKMDAKNQLFMCLSWLKNGVTMSIVAWLFDTPKSLVLEQSPFLVTSTRDPFPIKMFLHERNVLYFVFVLLFGICNFSKIF